MEHSIKVSKDACQGCVNCIRVCPTEAIRVVDGEIDIIEELCIDCGECLRSCCRSALGIYEDDWNRTKESSRAMIVPDPVFFSQFSHYGRPDDLEEVLSSLDLKTLIDEAEDAFDLSALCSRPAYKQIVKDGTAGNIGLLSVSPETYPDKISRAAFKGRSRALSA